MHRDVRPIPSATSPVRRARGGGAKGNRRESRRFAVLPERPAHWGRLRRKASTRWADPNPCSIKTLARRDCTRCNLPDTRGGRSRTIKVETRAGRDRRDVRYRARGIHGNAGLPSQEEDRRLLDGTRLAKASRSTGMVHAILLPIKAVKGHRSLLVDPKPACSRARSGCPKGLAWPR